MTTLDELIDDLKRIRDKIGQDSPVRIRIEMATLFSHRAVTGMEEVEYDDDTHMVLIRAGDEVAQELK
ncbi:hypothetical protein [Maritimibacter alexandrii]|uniref:hypothetical protein n=1 Tax=Maritimibacter alexandrii TaxID=2570355 RepID=UPI0011082204|nr:hypothetical protein [Maritimibacter alexandrii]